jgi:Domain of unknown function (DUF1844)
MPNKEQPEFIVTDRRKFTTEGELRPDVPEQKTEPEPPTQPVSQPAALQPDHASTEIEPSDEAAEQVAPPSAEDQQAQHDAYQQSNSVLDSQLRSELGGGQRVQEIEMTFERLAASMYMTALMQLGLDQQGEQRRVDIIGARQTIDTLSLLQDKTKNNLTPNEENLLRNCLYELRMAYVETMNAIARSAQAGPDLGKK